MKLADEQIKEIARSISWKVAWRVALPMVVPMVLLWVSYAIWIRPMIYRWILE